MNDKNIKNIAFYSFFKPAFKLEPVRDVLRSRMDALNIKGSILLSLEGINCSLAGVGPDMDAFLQFLFETIGIAPPELKISYSEKMPFKRSLVKVKPFIVVPPGKTPIDVTRDSADYISPEEFHRWIKADKQMVVLDTRNDFEYQVGRFKDSLHLGNKHFSEFEEDLKKSDPQWRRLTVVTFCTGGVRCEKAAPLMVKHGFQKVYQLEGGILNYFKKVGRGYFEGECFVFDERIAI